MADAFEKLVDGEALEAALSTKPSNVFIDVRETTLVEDVDDDESDGTNSEADTRRAMEAKEDAKVSTTSGGCSRSPSVSSFAETCEWPARESTPSPPMSPRYRGSPEGSSVSWPLRHVGDSSEVSVISWYRVAFLGGIEIRSGPSCDAARTGVVIMQNQVFPVTQEFLGADGRVYLQLADGGGWAFDDTALLPHDPSVVRLPWIYHGSWQHPSSLTLTSTEPVPVPCVPATSAPEASEVSWFRVAYLGGINLRSGPSFDAPLTGVTISHMETFPVAEEAHGADGRIYLRLCDGRGWAFDDSALLPHDPSVKRGSWMFQPTKELPNVLGEVQLEANQKPRSRRQHRAWGKRHKSRQAASV
eukprot:CAMPEP_0117459118 /NCGR_PEP_ID=MMETSP0784-20121206/1298_1 /TAXON_ID=39447 /ORGANISM="" /LENGTH=358 /DNA_ID=CAMNT_0005252691 /DNA_START=47 /DNA_END=1123 /DNA_ORIENTATION=+